MSKLGSVVISPKFYVWMILLMLGAMVGLILWSSWFGIKPGVVKAPLNTYDYIIVGGGTSGCVLASKLSANSSLSVLLVEAGQHFNWLSTIPLAAPLLQGSAQDWAYVTRPQTHSSYGLWNQSSSWPRGRGLGGSSQLNYLLHYRGNDRDFSRWVHTGASGWSASDIGPHMASILGHEVDLPSNTCPNDYKYVLIKSRKNSCRSMAVKIHVSRDQNSKLGKAFVAAGKELGFNFSFAESTIYRGQRWTSMDGFLRPALHRPNLHVLLNSHVDKVVWAKSEKMAVGVRLQVGNKKSQAVYSVKEVILSAGAVSTPQILIRSGVGPKTLLHRLGIPVVSNVPVGLNLHDHLNMPLYVSVDAPVSVTLRKLLHPRTLWDYLMYAEGPMASSGIAGVGTGPSHVGLVLFGMGSANERLLSAIANFRPETFRALFPFSGDSSHEGFVFLATCLQPQSRGRISIENVNPTSRPIIDPKYMTHANDISCMIDAVKLALQVISTTPFKQLNAKIHLPQFQECNYLEVSPTNASYLECIIRTAAITGYHPGGTCKMGSQNDPSTVVDPSLRVRGVRGLRVMDASILPSPVSGHPNSVLIAMADKASHMILQ